MKPIEVYELFNIRFIIGELEDILYDDDSIDTSGVTLVQTKTEVVAEVILKEYLWVGEVGEEVKATVVHEKN